MTITEGVPLTISPSSKLMLRHTALFGVLSCAYPILGGLEIIAPWLMWAGLGFFGGMTLLGGYQAVKARRGGFELRLGPEGVTVAGHPTAPWSDVAEVRVLRLIPWWPERFSWFMKGYDVIAFVPQPGAVLQTLPSARLGPLTARAERARERRFGSRLLLGPKIFDASTESILDAVARLSSVPIVHR